MSPASTAARSNSRRLIEGLGLTLWIAGVLLLHHWLAHVVRLLGLAILAFMCTRRRSLTPWLFFSMFAGVEYGLDLPHAAIASRIASDIFLRLIQCIVAPLIFGTLVTGIAGRQAGDAGSRVGSIALKAFVYFELLTTIALAIGLVAIHISRAGLGVAFMQHAVTTAPAAAVTWQGFLLHVFPANIAEAVASGNILAVAVFALIFGLALRRVATPHREPMLRLVESLTQTMFAFTNLVMYVAPLGVGAALAYTVATSGLGVMESLGKLLLTLYAALAAFALLAMLPAALLARVPVVGFLRAVAEPATIAFATSTSEAALPRAMEAMEGFGVPRSVTGLVIPAGYSFNLAGSALYLSLALVFIAQAAGMHLGWKQQAGMLLVLMLMSKGVAGVPRAVLVLLLATAGTFHLPEAPIFLILGIDALMDMGRTTVNVVGNCLAAAVVARWEGTFRQQDGG